MTQTGVGEDEEGKRLTENAVYLTNEGIPDLCSAVCNGDAVL